MALQRYGYKVLLAEDGRGAIDLVREQTGKIRLVLLDMTMPVMSGAEALAHLKNLAPELPIIVSSGHSEITARSDFGTEELAGFVQKPYTSTRLAEAVKEVLARPRR